MSEILNHGEKQVVLYSKRHFQETNMIEDLRSITAEAFGIPIESTEFYHVYDYVTKIFIKLQTEGYIQASIEKFLASLFTWDTPILKPQDMVSKMMARIQGIAVIGLNLGEPDEKYLPTKEAQQVQ